MNAAAGPPSGSTGCDARQSARRTGFRHRVKNHFGWKERGFQCWRPRWERQWKKKYAQNHQAMQEYRIGDAETRGVKPGEARITIKVF